MSITLCCLAYEGRHDGETYLAKGTIGSASSLKAEGRQFDPVLDHYLFILL